jgi:hypothetical protein
MKLPKTKRQKDKIDPQNATTVDSAQQKNILKILNKNWQTGLVISGIGILFIVAALITFSSKNKNNNLNNQTNVSPSSDTCATKNAPTYSCYKKELTDITKNQGPETATALVKSSYEKVPYVKSECHQLMHVIGRAALDKYGDVSGTYTHGDQFCWSGYYHGAMEQVAIEHGYDYILKNANNICSPIAKKSRYSFYHYNCVHGMGHGFMFVKDGDLFASLKSCDAITDSWERTSCYGGVFMQNVMNEQTPDQDANKGSKYLRADQPMYPCTAVDMQYKDQCYLMQTSYALQVENYNFSKVFKLCESVDQAYRDTCYTSLGRDASGNSISDVDKTKEKCLLGTTQESRQFCVRGAAMDFVSYFHSDIQAKKLCSSLPKELSTDCLSTVSSYYSTF